MGASGGRGRDGSGRDRHGGYRFTRSDRTVKGVGYVW